MENSKDNIPDEAVVTIRFINLPANTKFKPEFNYKLLQVDIYSTIDVPEVMITRNCKDFVFECLSGWIHIKEGINNIELVSEEIKGKGDDEIRINTKNPFEGFAIVTLEEI